MGGALIEYTQGHGVWLRRSACTDLWEDLKVVSCGARSIPFHHSFLHMMEKSEDCAYHRKVGVLNLYQKGDLLIGARCRKGAAGSLSTPRQDHINTM